MKRLLRRVTSRSKASRKNRSKSAHSDLRVAYVERNIDEEIAKKEVERNRDNVKATTTDDASQGQTAALSRQQSGSMSLLLVESSPAPTPVDDRESGLQSSKGKATPETLNLEAAPPAAADSRPSRKPTDKVKSKHSVTRSPTAADMASSMVQRQTSLQTSSKGSTLPLKDDSHSTGSKGADDAVTSRRPIVNSGLSYLGSGAGPTVSRSAARSRQIMSTHGHRHRTSRQGQGQSTTVPVPFKRSVPTAEARPFSELDVSPTYAMTRPELPSTGSRSSASELLPEDEVRPLLSPPLETGIHRSSSIASGRRHESLPNLSPVHDVDRNFVVDDGVPLLEIPAIPRYRVTEKRTWNIDTCSWEDAYTPPVINVGNLNSDWNSDDDSTDCLFVPDLSGVTSVDVDGRCKLRFESFSKPDIADGVWDPPSIVTTGTSCSTVELSSSRPPAKLRLKRTLRALENIVVGSSSLSNALADEQVTVAVVASQQRHSVNSDGGCCDQRVNDDNQKCTLYRAASCPVVLSLVHAEAANLAARSGRAQGKRGPQRVTAKSTFKRAGKSRRATATAAAVAAAEPQPPLFVGPSTWTGHGDLTGSMLSYESSV